MPEDDLYFIAFNKPPPVTLFCAAMEGISRHYPQAVMADVPDSLLAKYMNGQGPVLAIRTGPAKEDDDDYFDEFDGPGAEPLSG